MARKPRHESKATQLIALAILITVAAVVLFPDFREFRHLGYFGAFLIALISSATVFFPIPGWAIIGAMGRVMDPILLAIAAGLGAGIGELTSYMLGYGGVELIHYQKLKQYRQGKEWIKKYDALAIFVLAAIPNPIFDLAGIAAGAMEMPLWRFLIPCILGNMVKGLLVAELGLLSLRWF